MARQHWHLVSVVATTVRFYINIYISENVSKAMVS